MNKTALLVMDVQQGIVASLGDAADEFIGRVQTVVDAAHQQDIPVVYVTVRFRDNFPEISVRNKSFSALKQSGQPMLESDASTQIVLPVEPRDIHVTKRRISAFAGSDLEVVLRSLEATQLVLCGISTSGVVLSTIREAADKDFGLTVLSDGCYDKDSEVHRVLLEKIFPRQAEVISTQEWIATHDA